MSNVTEHIKRNNLSFYHIINLIDKNLNNFNNGLVKLCLSTSSFEISQNVINELRSTGLSVCIDNNLYIINISKDISMSKYEFLHSHLYSLDSYGKIFKNKTWKSQVKNLCLELLKNPNKEDNFLFWNVCDLNLYYSEIVDYFKSQNFIFNIRENKIYLDIANSDIDITTFLFCLIDNPNLIFD